MLPRPYHTVHTYLIGLWTLQRDHGHVGGTVWRLGGGFDCLLESEARIFGHHNGPVQCSPAMYYNGNVGKGGVYVQRC